MRIARKIIETGKQEDLITEQPNQGIKKPKQPEPATSAIQIRCRIGPNTPNESFPLAHVRTSATNNDHFGR
jgi:hypothetical protein